MAAAAVTESREAWLILFRHEDKKEGRKLKAVAAAGNKARK